ncbi:MAG: cytochrome c [Nitrospirales bacterium]
MKDIGAALVGSFVVVAVAMVVSTTTPKEASAIFGLFEKKEAKEAVLEPIPEEYKNKEMPAGWRDDPEVLAAGKEIYEGRANPDVECAKCHGSDGRRDPEGAHAPDLSDPKEALEPDDLWLWHVSEGKARTKMKGFKTKLTEEQRWQVLAYVRTLAQR